ncbi:hypothetical protein TCAL_10529 [Tigriopus californicus]|uniref:Innexin n=2 Tax=Tigriopus californicus TaxID=6832 RepID=A0A553PI24_TIGCA|nr:hypothetical protein TCAL_10529 [Tigriopus californicus]
MESRDLNPKMALDLLSSVRYLLKTEDISIDNWIFRLHYRITVLILLTSSAVGVAKQYFGDPINCQTASGVSSKVMDDYCWIHSTFHVRSEYQGNVGCILDTSLSENSAIHLVASNTPDTAFYQWVPFTLVFQALIFYIPRKLWKSFEGGLMEAFGSDSKQSLMLSTVDEVSLEDVDSILVRETVAKKYANFFQSTLHHNNGYFLQYFICEVLNFFIDVFNIFFTDMFLGGRFLRYGSQVMKFYMHSHAERRDLPNPMCTAFPTVTSCTFHSVGTAAGEQKFNSLCVLSLNIINEKIYLLLWFWFYFLTLLTGCHLVYRLFVILIPFTRSFLLLVRARMFSTSDRKTVQRILSRCYLGDWWVLYQLGRNSNTHFYRYLLRYLENTMYVNIRNGEHPRKRRLRQRSSSHLRDAEDDSTTPSGDEKNGSGTMRRRPHGGRAHTKIGMPYNI